MRRECRPMPKIHRYPAERVQALGRVMGDWDDPYLTMNYATRPPSPRSAGSLPWNRQPGPGAKSRSIGAAAARPPWPRPRSNTRTSPLPPSTSSFRLKDDVSGPDHARCLAGKTRVHRHLDHHPLDLPANLAIALHPDFDIRGGGCGPDEVLIIARELVENCMHTFGISDYTVWPRLTPDSWKTSAAPPPLRQRSLLILGTM
jgi:isoleucyl-tRNA synthetase